MFFVFLGPLADRKLGYPQQTGMGFVPGATQLVARRRAIIISDNEARHIGISIASRWPSSSEIVEDLVIVWTKDGAGDGAQASVDVSTFQGTGR